MRLSAPTMVVFVISAIVAVLAIVAQLGYATIPVISDNLFWSMAAAWGLVSLGCLLKRL